MEAGMRGALKKGKPMDGEFLYILMDKFTRGSG